MMKARKIPIRTCAACRTSSDKRGFVRVVRTPEGHVEVDPTGKANGRGTYVCANPDCFETALMRRRFDAALRVNLQDDDYARLRRDFNACLSQPGTDQGE